LPDLENHGTEATATPTDGTKLFRVIALLVNAFGQQCTPDRIRPAHLPN
jgi:hypothetical protein